MHTNETVISYLYRNQFESLQQTEPGKQILGLRDEIISLPRYQLAHWSLLITLGFFIVSIIMYKYIDLHIMTTVPPSWYSGLFLIWCMALILTYCISDFLFYRKVERSKEFQDLCNEYLELLKQHPAEAAIVNDPKWLLKTSLG